jgi:trk/ktr system potassium uptake protein
MRVVFVGASEVAVATAQALARKGCEVVIVETDKERISELSEQLDCSFLHGDGSRPDVLREANPKATELLMCLTDSDQANVIASLVGRSLGFKRVVTSIRDAQYEGICRELGLEDTIIPSRTIGRHLEDLAAGGGGAAELSGAIKGEARLFGFVAGEDDAGAVAELKLPGEARVVCLYRDGAFALADAETKVRKGDEVVILTHSRNLPALEQRWKRVPAKGRRPG